MEDLRVQKTKKLLKDSFKDLFLKKSFNEITIKELCEKSMINRRTFYLHYDSLDDLMTDILEDLSLEFLDYTKGYDHFKDIDRIIRDYFEFTSKNPLYEKLNNDSDLDYIREMLNSKVVKNVTSEFDSVKHLNDFEFNMARIYLNTSTVYMYRYWSNNGKSVPMDEAIKFTSNLIKNGLSSITS